MNKIRVIDLLNKIANGEKLPRKLKGNNHTYTGFEDLNYQICNYKDEDGDVLFSDDYDWCNPILLNETLEIIEEDKEIKKIEVYQQITANGNEHNYINYNGSKYAISTPQRLIIENQNKLIKEVNKLKKEVK